MLRTVLILAFIVSFSFGELVEETIEIDRDKLSLIGNRFNIDYINILNNKFLISGSHITSSNNKTIHIWDLDEKRNIFTIEDSQPINYVVCDKTKKYIAFLFKDNVIKLLNLETKKLNILKRFSEKLDYIQFDNNKESLLLNFQDGNVKTINFQGKIFNLEKNIKQTKSINNYEVLKKNANYGKESHSLIKLIDKESKEEIVFLKESQYAIRNPNISIDKKLLAYSMFGIKIVDMDSKKKLKTLKPYYLSSKIKFSPNKNILAIYNNRINLIKIWDIDKKKEILSFKGYRELTFSPDGKLLALANDTIKIFDIEKNKTIATFQNHSGVYAMSFSPNGKYLASTSEGAVKLWCIKNKKLLNTLGNVKVKYNSEYSYSLVFSPNGNYLAVGHKNRNMIKVWDISDVNNSKKITTLEGNNSYTNLIAFDSSGQLFTNNYYGGLDIWNINDIVKNGDNSKNFNLFTDNNNTLPYTHSLSFSPNGKYLVLGYWKNNIKIWNMESKKEVTNLNSGEFSDVSFNYNGKLLASSSQDGRIEVWNTENINKSIKIATLIIGENDRYIWLEGNKLKRKDDGKLVQKIKSQNGNFIELEPIYPNQPHDGNITILKYPEKVTIYEGQTGKGEITIKNDSKGRLWWIDLLEENTTNCNLFAPDRIQLLEANETKRLKFELSAIRDYEFPKEEIKTITLRLEAVKTKPIIIKVPIEIKSPMMKLNKVYLTDEKKGKILNVELQNIGGQDLNSSEIVTTLLTKDRNISLDRIEKNLIKAGEITKVTYPIDENLSLKDSKVKVFVRKNIYPIHTWEFESEIKIISSYFYHYIALAILVLIILYYIRILTHPLTKKLSLNPKALNNLDFKEIILAKTMLSRLYRLNTILSENEIDREVLDKTIEFYQTKDKAKKVKILSERVLSDSQKLKENLFRINLTKEFILNIKSIDITFIDKLNDETQKELNEIKTFTIVVTNNTIREKLKAKNYLLIIPTSNEIARVLISNNSLLALSHLLSNYIKLSQISPYQISQGVRNSLMFFGREKSLSHILSRELTNYFLIGARQIGKSSFLKEIERNYEDISGIDCRYYTLHDDNLLELLGINLWAKNDLKLEEFIQKIRVYGKPILFLLDEVDKFIVSETKSDFKILNAFRALSEEGKCFFVMAGYWELYKSIYLNYFSPIKNFGEALHIEELEYKACIDLATKPMNALNLSYENESIVKEMVESCGQRANLIAINCNLMIQKLNLKDKIITKEMIESTQKSQDFVSHLKFSESNKLAQMILYFTIELNSFNLSELVEILENEEIKFEIESLKEALNKMEIAFYIKKIENRYYYRVPLFINYIRSDDLEILKREIKKA